MRLEQIAMYLSKVNIDRLTYQECQHLLVEFKKAADQHRGRFDWSMSLPSAQVLLDGSSVARVKACDVREGWVEVIRFDDTTGQPIIAPNGTELLTQKFEGEVRVRFGGEVLGETEWTREKVDELFRGHVGADRGDERTSHRNGDESSGEDAGQDTDAAKVGA